MQLERGHVRTIDETITQAKTLTDFRHDKHDKVEERKGDEK